MSKALKAMDCIMADDLEEANKILDECATKSAYPDVCYLFFWLIMHAILKICAQLGRGVLAFISATLGFEADVIKNGILPC